MPVPDFQSLMLPVLRAAADGEISASDLRERVAASVGLTESDLAEMLPSGRQTTFTNRTAWANVFLQRAGLLEKARRGVYRISDEGRRVLAGATCAFSSGTPPISNGGNEALPGAAILSRRFR
jgi:restriction system protein